MGVCSESAIEAVILIDLFHDALGFSKVSTKSQSLIINGCKPDILLKPLASSQVVVEVKRPGELKGKPDKASTIAHLKQAASYVRCLDQEFGILTDGTRWFYFRIAVEGESYLIHRLLDFDLEVSEQKTFINDALLCSNKTALLHFFFVLKQMQKSIVDKPFHFVAGMNVSERLNYFVSTVKDTEIEEHNQPATWAKVTTAERRVIKFLCYGENPHILLKPIHKPIEVGDVSKSTEISSSVTIIAS